jgi:hypothetical protein
MLPVFFPVFQPSRQDPSEQVELLANAAKIHPHSLDNISGVSRVQKMFIDRP